MTDTRQEILDVSSHLFIEQGYEGTSLREIAEKVGVTKAALYYHFDSKAALLDALITPAFDFLRSIVPLIEGTTDLDRWGDAIGTIIDWLAEQQELFALMNRNSEVIRDLAGQSAAFVEHEDLHESFRSITANHDIPLEHRVRLMCAMGVATAMFEFGDGIMAESPDAIRPLLRGLANAVLHAELPTD